MNIIKKERTLIELMQNNHSIYVDLDIDKGYVALSSCLNFKDGSKGKPVTENRDLYFHNGPST